METSPPTSPAMGTNPIGPEIERHHQLLSQFVASFNAVNHNAAISQELYEYLASYLLEPRNLGDDERSIIRKLWYVTRKWLSRRQAKMERQQQYKDAVAADLEYRQARESNSHIREVDARLDTEAMLATLPETTRFIIQSFYSTGSHEAAMQRFDCSESTAVDVFNTGIEAMRARFAGQQ